MRARVLRVDQSGTTEVVEGIGPTLSVALDSPGAYRVEVLPRPAIDGFDVTYRYPRAIGRSPETVTDANEIAAVVGTPARLSVRPSTAGAGADEAWLPQ